MKIYYQNSCMTLLLVILCFSTSCKENADPSTEKIELEVKSTENENDESNDELDVAGFQDKLQGTWKRIDYPYSTYIFKNDEAKLISEGLAEEPTFQPIKLSKGCPFADEFNEELMENQFIYSNEKFESCEIYSLSNDTLKTSDLAHSYEIVYARQ